MVEDLYSKSASRDVYTKEIGREMEKMTGKETNLVIHCGAEPEEMEGVRNEVLSCRDDKIRIGYPGTIISENTFSCFMAALKMLPPAMRGRVEVHLFGSHSYRRREWFDPSMIVEHGYLPEEELERRYRDCDWGLAIMALDDSDPRYNKFSFPCKFARALASGLPVLCLAHRESTLASFAMNYTFSPVLAAADPAAMAAELNELLHRGPMKSQLRSEILDCLEREFNAEKNREALFCVFSGISRAPHPTPTDP
jgi:glycosyltransferase involved in cell wall biosynthesis